MAIADERLPLAGAWAKCPGCQERFYIKPPGQPVDLSAPPQAFPPLPANSQANRDLAARIKRRQNRVESREEVVEYDPEAITVFPERAASPAFYSALAGFLLLLPLAAVAVAFSRVDIPPPPAPKYGQPLLAAIDPKTRNLVRNELIGLRREFMNRRPFSSGVNYSGPESRIFNYFMEILAPEACGGISYLKIESSAPRQGFTATGTCTDDENAFLKLDITWPNRHAVAQIQGYAGQEEIELFPIPGQSPAGK
jgi:hypothetical protein